MHLIAFCCPLSTHLLSLNLRSSRSPAKPASWKAVRVISINYIKPKVFEWECIHIFIYMLVYVCICLYYTLYIIRAVACDWKLNNYHEIRCFYAVALKTICRRVPQTRFISIHLPLECICCICVSDSNCSWMWVNEWVFVCWDWCIHVDNYFDDNNAIDSTLYV